MDKRGKQLCAIAVSVLVLVTLACSLPGGISVPLGAPTEEQVGEATPETDTPTPTEAPTEPSPSPQATEEPGCDLGSTFVSDPTVPDGTEFAPGASFTKVWRIRNTGTCNWEPGTRLTFISGDQMDAPSSVPVGAVSPGSTIDISANMEAPTEPGTYEGNWQLQTPDGTFFGDAVHVRIEVPGPVTVSPEITPTLTPTLEACVPPAPPHQPILDRAEDQGYDLGCPTAEAFSVNGAFQEFWTNVDDPNPHTHFRSLMIWRSDNREIYVIDGEDTDASEGQLMAYTDFWEEGQPEVPPDCADMTPPAGHQIPIRGFGKVWCENELRDEVGWPRTNESAVNLLIQPTETGLLLKVSGPIPIWYLVALDSDRAVTSMTGP